MHIVKAFLLVLLQEDLLLCLSVVHLLKGFLQLLIQKGFWNKDYRKELFNVSVYVSLINFILTYTFILINYKQQTCCCFFTFWLIEKMRQGRNSHFWSQFSVLHFVEWDEMKTISQKPTIKHRLSVPFQQGLYRGLFTIKVSLTPKNGLEKSKILGCTLNLPGTLHIYLVNHLIKNWS